MAQPIKIEEMGEPKSVQFAHFGVLNDGAQSKTSTLTAAIINVLLAFVIVVIGAATKKTIDNRQKLTELTMPIPEMKKIEPIKPKIIPPKPIKLPEPPKLVMQPPKINVPEIKLPDPPKMVKMDEPKPVVMPAPPKAVVAMAAPKPVAVNLAQNAAVVNNSPHPSAVALGSTSNPIAPSTAAVSNVNLGNKGMAGMPASNTGMGRPSAVNLAGSGAPNGSMSGTGAKAVQGVKLGVTGGTGPNNATGRVAGPVNLAVNTPPPAPKPAGIQAPPVHNEPKVLSKPTPEYTAEAKSMHLEGTVRVHIHVLPNGSVEVVGVTDHLGHGLDESAMRAAAGTKFQPATDASGNPIVWDGFVKITFQLAG